MGSHGKVVDKINHNNEYACILILLIMVSSMYLMWFFCWRKIKKQPQPLMKC